MERGRNCVERNRQRAGAGRERSGSPPRARVLTPHKTQRLGMRMAKIEPYEKHADAYDDWYSRNRFA
ncbi:MAG: hypothetical protein ACXW4S_09770, partial [Candidatus Deferrimicrobiaceae bacterium]